MAHDGPRTRGAALPSPVVQTALWSLAAVVTTIALAAATAPLHAPRIGWLSFAALTVIAVSAGRQDVWAQVRSDGDDVQEMVDLDEVAVVLLLFLLEPLWVLLIAIPTYGLALGLERTPPIKVVFNLASRTTTIGIAAAITAQFTEPPVARLDLDVVAVVLGAVLVHVVLNFVSVKTVIAAATGSTVSRTIRSTSDLNLVMWVGNATLGLAAAALWLQHPVLVLAAAGLASVVRRAYDTVVVVNGLADELGLERDRLRDLVDGGRDGILQLDAAGAIAVWNPALERLTGLPATVAIGSPVDDLLADRVVVDTGPPTLAAAVLGTALPDDQHLTVTINGEERSLVARHSLQRDKEGDVVGDIVQLHDRTATARAARIEHDFLARVTHELLTPLTVIRGVTQTVLRHGPSLSTPVHSDLLRRLGRNTAHMEGLVHDLLAVNAARQPGPRPEPAVLDLWELVQEAVAAEVENWPDHVVEVAGDEVLGPVRPAAFTTVVRHLVRNACNYSPEGSAVRVTLAADEVDGSAVLRVTDRGRGIPSSRLEEMFAPFTRIEDPMRMETRGIGLGLHLVRQLVDELGGAVDAQSAPGQGSTFEVRLPVALAVRQHTDSH